MKNTFKLLLLAVVAGASGCASNKNESTPVPVPSGTFAGKFTSLHKKKSGAIDTLRANILLTTTTAGLFKVTGDTATVHAGSHGAFQLNAIYIQFQDSTATSNNPAKIHLNGLYQYYYNGTVFQIAAGNDTLAYQYDLKRN
ncbi:hypothetical protein [Mucilaginibacter paludis]|uniref:Lipoprotein n=1 Tax=Mucilaginibacter paludis DSM 18603 TaxID=714943 RepID=H1Y7P2_9SPHI|nr:hypothetical protein [Mucilaginibacter paludis]EHQ29887.1 hypothetical protein Mucpa_5820 [Mucilaginibacter paludis DSM 18603]